MKNKNTSGLKAIAKTIFVICAALLAVSVKGQAYQEKAEYYHNEAAKFWMRAEDSEKDSMQEVYLKKAAVYADSAKIYYLKEHQRLLAEKAKYENRDNTEMANWAHTQDSAIGKDTTDVNSLIKEINKGLKRFQKQPATGQETSQSSPNTNTKSSNNPSTNSNPTNKPSSSKNKDGSLKTIETEMLQLNLSGGGVQPGNPGVKKEQTDSLKPRDGKQKNGVVEPGTSSGIITPTTSKITIQWEGGADAGVTWTTSAAAQTSVIHLNDPSFGTDSEIQEKWNAIFNGATFIDNKNIKVTTYPDWQLSLNAGCIINKRFEIKLAAAGRTFTSMTELPVTVAKVVPPTASAPPATIQSKETVQEKVLTGNFNSRVTGRVYFGKKVRGFAEAGAIVGLFHSGAVKIMATNYSETKNVNQTAVYGGATIGTGINIPLTRILSFETGVTADFPDIKKKIAAGIGMNAGLRILF